MEKMPSKDVPNYEHISLFRSYLDLLQQKLFIASLFLLAKVGFVKMPEVERRFCFLILENSVWCQALLLVPQFFFQKAVFVAGPYEFNLTWLGTIKAEWLVIFTFLVSLKRLPVVQTVLSGTLHSMQIDALGTQPCLQIWQIFRGVG